MPINKILFIPDFDELLSYHLRSPIWIKFPTKFLEDERIQQLTEIEQAHYFKILLLASRLQNQIPTRKKFLRDAINTKEEINVKKFVRLGLMAYRTCPEKVFNSKETKGEGRHTEEIREDKTRQQQTTTPETAVEVVPVVGVGVVSDEKSEEKTEDSPLSAFSLKDCFRYVKICEQNGQQIKSKTALAKNIYQTGEADFDIEYELYPEKFKEKYGNLEPIAPKTTQNNQDYKNPCRKCGNSGWIITDKGAVRCGH